jgi:HAD superfamily hydrolase (TIGR01549 family)
MEFDPPMILPRGVLLDMDDTLTEPMLDYAAIRAEVGAGSEPILEAMAKMDPIRQARAWEILHRHELLAAEGSTLRHGCRDLLDWLRHRGIPTALVTRNSRSSAQTVIDRHNLRLDVLITRDDGPHKPDPRSIFLACERLNVDPADVWMVGDGRHDVEAGVAAGVRTVWLSLGRERHFAAKPWRVVEDLLELREMLRACEA